ncbi:MAG: 5-bromo-4-chloroindolyl phosphate hydrolysis family protein [Clostridiales bacterium]|nr:5-bromo-4-chloroindolyl phosphate hydrolysis family protein [Clostridiales bacterium]
MTKRIKSVIPIYLMATAFALYCLLLPMHRITDLVIALAVAILIYRLAGLIFRGKIVELPREITFEKSGNDAADAMIAQGREYIRRLEELGKTIADPKIVGQIAHLQQISIQIFEFIQKNPGHVRKINTFMDYYYPTAIKLLDSYARFDTKSVRGENISEAMAKISDSLSKVEEAFAHQLDNLYSDKALDITTDIAVLENIMKSEGVK